MQKNNYPEKTELSGNRPEEKTDSSAHRSHSRIFSAFMRKDTLPPVQEEGLLPGVGESFVRWLGEGIFSGTPVGALRGVTDILFFLSFIVCYGWGYINTTMFKRGFSDAFELRMEGLLHFAVLNALVCGIIALLLQNSLQQAILEIVLLAAGFCHWKFGAGKYEYFVFCVLIVGMTGRSFKILLSIAFTIGSVITAAAFVASQLGIITDLVYEGGRHSFGIIYCTDCAAHFLYLMVIYVFLRLDSLSLVEYVSLILALALMLLTKAQSDIVCGALLLAGILIFRLTRRWHKRGGARIIASIASFSFIIFAIVSFAGTLGFNRNDLELRKKIPYSLIRRLEMNQEALSEHPFSLFGSVIEEHGFGGRTENLPGWDKYFFLDCSYIRLYIIGGALLFAMILLVMTYAQLRCFAYRRYDLLFLLMLIGFACVMEHHLMEYYYNVFPLMAFSGRRLFREDPIPGSG